jgi:hypothetical protein
MICSNTSSSLTLPYNFYLFSYLIFLWVGQTKEVAAGADQEALPLATRPPEFHAAAASFQNHSVFLIDLSAKEV